MREKTPLPTEYDEQKVLVQWLELKKLRFSKLAQETWTPSWGQRARNKASGLRKGVPDMMIIAPGRLLFVELKRAKKASRTSPEQLEWVMALNAIPNVRAKVCRGAEEAITFIKLAGGL